MDVVDAVGVGVGAGATVATAVTLQEVPEVLLKALRRKSINLLHLRYGF